MTYAYDPDIAAGVSLLPVLDLSDPGGSRARERELLIGAPPADLTGIEVHNLRIEGPEEGVEVGLRVYTPVGTTTPRPGLYHVHGGAYVMGSAEMDHVRNAQLCRELGAVIVAVDYRLAPEDPFPAGLDDCFVGLEWMVGHAEDLGLDPERIAVRGVSAGGGLAAALALRCRDQGGPVLCFQHLSIPQLDDRLETESMRTFTDTPLWHRAAAEISWDSYLGPGRRGAADVPSHAAPSRATDLSSLPPAYVSAMEFDPLRDEGIAYACGLLAAGVSVELHVFPGTFHGSCNLVWAQASQREAAEEIVVLRRALYSGELAGTAVPFELQEED